MCSAPPQVRIEHAGRVWVASGDYHLAGHGQANPTCPPFEPVRCDCFITESTFGLPIYRWPRPETVFADLHAWWQANAAAGRTSLLNAYSLGKAQRLLAGLDPSVGPIAVHGTVAALNEAYAAAGVRLPRCIPLSALGANDAKQALVIAPPQAADHPALRTGPPPARAFASGWMQVRKQRRRQTGTLGLVLSDHADWPGLLGAIAATRCDRVIVTHGFEAPLIHWLGTQGLDAGAFRTAFSGESDERVDTPG